MNKNEAIELLERLKSRIANDSFELALDFAIKALEERPTGKWQARSNKDYAGGGYYFCNKCSQRYSFGGYFELDNENFCPNCGADMKGAKR